MVTEKDWFEEKLALCIEKDVHQISKSEVSNAVDSWSGVIACGTMLFSSILDHSFSSKYSKNLPNYLTSSLRTVALFLYNFSAGTWMTKNLFSMVQKLVVVLPTSSACTESALHAANIHQGLGRLELLPLREKWNSLPVFKQLGTVGILTTTSWKQVFCARHWVNRVLIPSRHKKIKAICRNGNSETALGVSPLSHGTVLEAAAEIEVSHWDCLYKSSM